MRNIQTLMCPIQLGCPCFEHLPYWHVLCVQLRVTIQNQEKQMDMQMRSPAFKPGSRIPSRYTCEGDDISPPLSWSEGPEGTRSYAVILDDPDAPSGTWTHWLLFNIPADRTSLPENLRRNRELPDGSRQGVNDFTQTGYGGPCPPDGAHVYCFRIFALDSVLDLDSEIKGADLLTAMESHVLADGVLKAEYQCR